MRNQETRGHSRGGRFGRGVLVILIAGFLLPASIFAQAKPTDNDSYCVGYDQAGSAPDEYIRNFESIHEALEYVYKKGYKPTEHVNIDVFPGTYLINWNKEELFNTVDIRNGTKYYSRIKVANIFYNHAVPFVHLRYAGDDYHEALILCEGVESPFWISKGSVEGLRVQFDISHGPAKPPTSPQSVDDEVDHVNKGISITGPAEVNNCRVEGFEIGIAGFCASNFSNSREAHVVNCEVYNNDHGFSNGEMNVYYQNNYVHDNNTGMGFGPGGSPYFTDNLIESNDIGIFINSYHAWAVYAVIQNNVLRGNRVGIQAYNYGVEEVPENQDETRVAMPIVAAIQNNIIFGFSEKGIECIPFDPGKQTENEKLMFGYMPFLRNNDVFAKLGAVHYFNCPQEYDSISANPKLDADGYLMETSPCIDAGSFTLNPGYATEYMNKDIGQIDLGYHHNDQAELPEFMGQTWIIDQQGRIPFDFRSIQAALDSDQVNDEDILRVRQGQKPYRECIQINKQVLLTSELPGENNRPIIQWISPQTVLTIMESGSGACINNFEIIKSGMYSGTGYGVLIQSECIISNCLIADHDTGIRVETEANGVIQYTTVSRNTGDGISISKGYNGRLFSNWIETSSGDGIHIVSDPTFETKVVIENNTISECAGEGVDIEYAAELPDKGIALQFFNNVVYNNWSYGFNMNRMYTELKGQTGIFPHMRNNCFYNNNCPPDASETEKTSSYNNFHHGPMFQWKDQFGKIHDDFDWYCPYPPNGENHSVRMFNPMSFNPLYYLPHRLLSDRSECIDAGCYNLDPGYSQTSGPDTARIDMGMHTP